MSKNKKGVKSFVLFNLYSVGALHAINNFISSSAIAKNILNPGVGDFYKWKYGDIFYRKIGEGNPVLLIHDLSSFSSGYEWNQIEAKLSKDHTVYTIDLLGCGRSSKPAITYTNFLYVQLISDFISEIIGMQTDIAVTGLSSSFVSMIALSKPELFHNIMIVNPYSLNNLEQSPNERSKIIFNIMSIPIIGTAIYFIKTCRQNIEYHLTEKDIYNPFRIQQKTIDAYYEASHRGHGDGRYLMASIDGFYLTANVRKAIQSTSVPITIIIGDKVENEREIAEQYKKENNTIKIKSVFDTKMLPQIENPDETYKVMNRILEQS